jgi:hypothetical protein
MATIIMVKNRPKPGGTMLPEGICIGISHKGKKECREPLRPQTGWHSLYIPQDIQSRILHLCDSLIIPLPYIRCSSISAFSQNSLFHSKSSSCQHLLNFMSIFCRVSFFNHRQKKPRKTLLRNVGSVDFLFCEILIFT